MPAETDGFCRLVDAEPLAFGDIAEPAFPEGEVFGDRQLPFHGVAMAEIVAGAGNGGL